MENGEDAVMQPTAVVDDAENEQLGTMDLKIASIPLANDVVLLTRNLSDFNKVPDLKVEYWSL